MADCASAGRPRSSLVALGSTAIRVKKTNNAEVEDTSGHPILGVFYHN
jgi:hypothetical protein